MLIFIISQNNFLIQGKNRNLLLKMNSFIMELHRQKTALQCYGAIPRLLKKRSIIPEVLPARSSLSTRELGQNQRRYSNLLNLHKDIFHTTESQKEKSIDIWDEIAKSENRLKKSINLYEDYKEIINPSKNYIDKLCPFKVKKKESSSQAKFANILKDEYEIYKQESLKVLKKTEFRLRKAQHMIQTARQLSSRHVIKRNIF